MTKQDVQLQQPKWLFFNGAIRPWEDAVLHVSSEAVVWGLNVFEGLKGFWQPDGGFGLLTVERHWRRLRRSAKLLHIPFEMGLNEFDQACHELIQALCEPRNNMWIRATLYVTEGHWGAGTKSDLVLTAFQHPKGLPAPVATGVSTWQRASDLALPCRIKTSTNYQVRRLAKIEGRDRGYDDMVLLNQHGRVAEGAGSAIILVRDGAVVTPPSWEGTLESITVDIVEELCKTAKVPFKRRPVERTELLIADEMAFAGTLCDVALISSIDGHHLGDAPVLTSIATRYMAAVTGTQPHPAVDLSIRPRTTSNVAATAKDKDSLDRLQEHV